jgi:hypothetical protein
MPTGFTSILPKATGLRVVWDGIRRFQLTGGIIAHDDETVGTTIALTQVNFLAKRIARVAGKHVESLRGKYGEIQHLPDGLH